MITLLSIGLLLLLGLACAAEAYRSRAYAPVAVMAGVIACCNLGLALLLGLAYLVPWGLVAAATALFAKGLAVFVAGL